MKTQLELQLNELETSLETLNSKQWDLTEKFEKNLNKYFKEWFRDILDEDITLACSTGVLTFHKKNESKTFTKEVFTLYLEKGYSTSLNYYKDIALNYYTCGSVNDDFEMSRLENLGKVAFQLRTNRLVMLDAINLIAHNYTEAVKDSNYSEDYSTTQAKIRLIKEQLKQVQEDQMKEKLCTTGVHFDLDKILPEIQFQSGRKLQVSFIRVEQIPFRKTCNVFIKQRSSTEDSRIENVKTEELLKQMIYYEGRMVTPELTLN